jgi:enoyl-CoA hydratase/carnithine racemase
MSSSEPRQGFTGAAVTLTWPEPGIALATMTRGARMNTLSLELIGELGRALDEADAGRARALILTGSERAFCAGAHLAYFTDPDPRIGRGPLALRDNYLAHIARVFDRIEDMPFPVIAAINGFALGGGCEMAIACDFRLIADSTRIGLPEVKIGAVAGAGGVQKLHRLVGRGKALEWVLLGSHVSPAEALAHGLVTSVHPAAELLDAAFALARRFKELGPLAVAQSKAALHMSSDVDHATARRIGLEALALCIDGAEWTEGMAAFMAKRPPDFKDRP